MKGGTALPGTAAATSATMTASAGAERDRGRAPDQALAQRVERALGRELQGEHAEHRDDDAGAQQRGRARA